VNLRGIDFKNYSDCILRVTAAMSDRNSISRDPGKILGGPNSAFNNPGQIWGGFPVLTAGPTVHHYPRAKPSLKEARTQENISLSGRGPYLLAWSPATQKGQKDAIVLILDLSSAFTPAHFEDAFREWRSRIEENPNVWRQGWVIADLRTEVRYWADKWGMTILSFGRAKE
jgi:hypothetical protein